MTAVTLLPRYDPALPSCEVGRRACRCAFLEFFTANIRNLNTRRAYARAASEFLTWCAEVGVSSLAAVASLHVSTWIEVQMQRFSAPSVKQRLAAIRHLFDWVVTGQIVPHNPAASVRRPSHISRAGKTPVLDLGEARQLLDSIDISTPASLRDRALIGLMVFSFARICAALTMRVDDVCMQNPRLWGRLRVKKVANSTRCHAITLSKNTCVPTW